MHRTDARDPPDLARLLRRGVRAKQADAAVVRNILAVEHVEARALARAVGADQRQDLAGPEFERDATHGMDTAIGLGQTFNG
jgi:hypothetical protein